MAARPRVLVFQKNTARRRVVGGPARKDGEGEDPLALSLKRSRQTHLRAIETLQVVLDRLGISARFVWLTDRVDSTGFDLVIALGGDGTVLHASHQIGPTPMLAINSAPEHSVGYLTAVPIEAAEPMIVAALEGKLGVTKLQRMAVDIDGRRVYGRVLNDVLFSHECPARTARYSLCHGDAEESQMSSGIWIGPAAGSTAAQSAAGGRVLKPRSRLIQYIVREPYSRTGVPYRLVRGLVRPGERLAIRSGLDAARLFVDGPHVVLKAELGEVIELGLSEEPLRLLGFRRPSR